MSQANAFIEKLKEQPFREALSRELLTVAEGDWNAVVQIAAKAGYKLTVEDLKAAVPTGFFKGGGQDPDLGWDRASLSS